MNREELQATAQALVAKSKGIVAADESDSTIARRLKSVNVDPTEENRRSWRQLLITAKGSGNYISGIILFDETIRQSTDAGQTFVDALKSENIIPGIKVDKGAKALANSPNETVTEGLDGLRERLQEYYELGARFTKWRAVMTIGDSIPTSYCIDVNAHALGRFATLSQEAGLVPIVEPEVLMDGGHDIKRCFEITEATLQRVFEELHSQSVFLGGMLLKPNMVLSGSEASGRASSQDVAEHTIDCFKRTVPAEMPGIVFLSGGQSDDEATVNLNAINQMVDSATPWQLSFSYGRGLQATPLKIWSGDSSKVSNAQQAYLHRAKVTSAARDGVYKPEMDKG
ncbi:MAG: fructose-bisphosphate aldolase, class I [Chloroflexi bacterium]|jgi:fructose-bisphosphate aldolase class I|nr:MAG: fructose-bisphosphate aldolase, class I [Chloroflexota bacterium]